MTDDFVDNFIVNNVMDNSVTVVEADSVAVVEADMLLMCVIIISYCRINDEESHFKNSIV